jgi:phosphate transport system permease protein
MKKRANKKSFRDHLFVMMTYTAALLTIIILLGIILSIFREGLPLFQAVRIRDFLTGFAWYPTHEPAQYGIASMLAGSFYVTLGALIIAIPFGLGAAVYIAEIASARTREMIKPVIELLAGIPSVVYGLFGMAFLAPFVQHTFHVNTGLNVFSCSIILGIMVIPIITSLSEDALSTVPKNIREASLALGATPWETITRITIPSARTGIIGSILLGFGRAIGETMVILMVAGGSAQIPHSIFDSVRPLTATIAAEMGETVMGDTHYHALFAIAIVLLIITFITNLLTDLVFLKRGKK